MGVVWIVVSIKSKLEDQGITSMFLGYARNHKGSACHLLNLLTKLIVLIRDNIWLNKTYGEYVSRNYHIRSDSYILQDEDKSDRWDYIIIDPAKTEYVKN